MAVLLLSTLYIITITVNLFSCFQSFSILIILLAVAAIFGVVNTKAMDGQSKHFQLCLLVITMLNWLFICLSEADSSAPSYCTLIVRYISTAVNFNYSLSASSKKHANHDPNCSLSASQA